VQRMDDTEETMRAVLEARREQLHKIDGDMIFIDVFVEFYGHGERVEQEAREILGSLPLRVVVSEVPEAQ
jgi:hypothetical protein